MKSYKKYWGERDRCLAFNFSILYKIPGMKQNFRLLICQKMYDAASRSCKSEETCHKISA